MTEEYETQDLQLFESKKRIYPLIKCTHLKICSVCKKEFMGFKTSSKCPTCIKKEADKPKKRQYYCTRCHRHSPSLKLYAQGTSKEEWLCSFCMKRATSESYYQRNFGDIKPLLNKVCPECKKSFETRNSTKVYCTEDCKSIVQNRRVRAYYIPKTPNLNVPKNQKLKPNINKKSPICT